MALDLIVRNANLPDGRTGIDIAVRDGRMVEIGAAIDADAAQEVALEGRLVSPPLVDAHFHLESMIRGSTSRVKSSP